MKKYLILFSLIFGFASLAFSQSTEVQNAYREWNKGKLDKAKISIDKAAAYESTMNDPKTLLYKGGIYYDIAVSPIAAFQQLSPNALEEAYAAFQKAYQFDTKKKYEEDLVPRMMAVSELYFNRGVKSYEKGVQGKNKGDLLKAVELFEQSIKINEGFGKIDTLAIYNAAFVSQLADDDNKALQYYQKLLKYNYNKPNIYVSLSNVYKNMQDTAMALKIAAAGRNLYKQNLDLLITETNIYLAQKKMDKAKDNLYQAMKMDSTNPTIFFAVGTVWDSTGNYAEAELAYKKAIKLQPDYVDAIYNLGILYYNNGVTIFKAADAITNDALYAKEKEKFEAAWNNAIPYLEKAFELKPDDEPTIFALKQIYARLNLTEKRKALEEKIAGQKK